MLLGFILGALALYSAMSIYIMWTAHYHPTMSTSFVIQFLLGPWDAIKVIGKIPPL